MAQRHESIGGSVRPCAAVGMIAACVVEPPIETVDAGTKVGPMLRFTAVAADAQVIVRGRI